MFYFAFNFSVLGQFDAIFEFRKIQLAIKHFGKLRNSETVLFSFAFKSREFRITKKEVYKCGI